MHDPNYIESKISKKEDIFGRNILLQKIELDDSFPEYLLKNQKKFINFII